MSPWLERQPEMGVVTGLAWINRLFPYVSILPCMRDVWLEMPRRPYRRPQFWGQDALAWVVDNSEFPSVHLPVVLSKHIWGIPRLKGLIVVLSLLCFILWTVLLPWVHSRLSWVDSCPLSPSKILEDLGLFVMNPVPSLLAINGELSLNDNFYWKDLSRMEINGPNFTVPHMFITVEW